MYAFLSIFKWEDRKNPTGLLEAYLSEFSAAEPVALYLRSGGSASAVQEAVDRLVEKHAIAAAPRVVWVPKTTHAEYAQLFAGADAFVLPTHGEGWGAFLRCGRVFLLLCLLERLFDKKPPTTHHQAARSWRQWRWVSRWSRQTGLRRRHS